MPKLTPEEINRRLSRLRNYERLYPGLQQKYEVEKRKRKALEQRLRQLEAEYAATVEALKLQIEELRKMVFGKSRKHDDTDADGPAGGSPAPDPATAEKGRKKRPPASYRRPVPDPAEVTEEKHYPAVCCPDCNGQLTRLREAVRYLEDIVLPQEERPHPLKAVVREVIETGFCPHCRRWHSAVPVAKPLCRLGGNVRKRIVYVTTILGLTYGKVADDLRDTFGVAVSDGEIDAVLTGEAGRLLPEYHHIDARIRDAPCRHFDETGYPVQQGGEGQWGWVKTASNTSDTLFRLGRSRGKGNAKLLRGDPEKPAVTDDYPGYKNLWDKHALCWAHPHRKFRDLAKSSSLTASRKAQCVRFYERFCELMDAVRLVCRLPYDRLQREKAAARFRRSIRELCRPAAADPPKLATLKQTFLENTEKYLLCIREPDIPMTNNKAERSLRPLVIKRKLSFGSKTQKGADVMSILLSVCLTTWWQKQENFYSAYDRIIRKWQTG